MAKKCVAFSFAFMITGKLFLLHRLLFIPYFNNPQGGGEGMMAFTAYITPKGA